MMRWIEFTLFLALAIVPHLIIFIGRTQSGVTAGGGGGDTAVTLRAAAPTVAEMVQSWEEPSVVQTAPPTELSFSRPLSVDNPTRPVVQADEAQRAQIAIAIAVPEAEDPVQIDSTPPPPPILETAIEPASDVGPKQRPPKKPMQEGRMMYAISAITDGNPFEHIVGWKDDLVQYDPDAFRKFEAVFPEDTQRMINFGNPYAGVFSIEAVLEADADLVLLDSGNLFKAEETGLIEKLDKAGVPVVFVDFRRNATENTVPSLLILGRILGEEKGAAKFIDFYISEMKKVTNVVDQIPAEERPLVVLENAAGWQPDFCCWSFGPYNYGRFVELAGGMNYASMLENAYSVSLSMEGVIDADPDHVIGTGANWAEAKPEVTSTLLGYEGDPAVNAEKIAALAARPGFAELRAVKDGNYHSIYHQFYNSPYHFVAIQQIAKWLYPEDFEDLDPQDTFERLHAEFMPYEASGQFWLSADQ